MPGFVCVTEDVPTAASYRPTAATYSLAACAGVGPLPCFGGVGTGGFEGMHFFMSRQGYKAYAVVANAPDISPPIYAPYTDLMKEVRAGFGRTVAHLPAVFGVSRQTLYNWLAGEIPKVQHQQKLVQLAIAARVFTDVGFRPTALALERVIAHGKSFLALIGQGADGRETAERLVRLAKRGASSREKLDALMGDRIALRPGPSEMGSPFLDEWS